MNYDVWKWFWRTVEFEPNFHISFGVDIGRLMLVTDVGQHEVVTNITVKLFVDNFSDA